MKNDKSTKANALRNLNEAELGEKLTDSQKRLFELRFQLATDRLETPGAIRHTRRDIARMLTIQRQRALATQAPAQ